MTAFADDVTPLVLTRDEEPNIARTLGQLDWAREVVVVDSGSSDRTVELARRFANVRVVVRPLDDLASQWNFALAQASTPWVLTLDADYFVPAAFVRELRALDPPDAVAAYEAAFDYAVHGRRLRASLYPPRAVLLRRERVLHVMDGHTQRPRIDGSIGRFNEKLVHDDRKPFSRFLARQRVYMRDEARKIRATPMRELSTAGKLRKLRLVAPFAVLVHTLFVRRALLDGWPGWIYAGERFAAEVILSLELFRSSRRRGPEGPSSS
jgi:glycosyltransferase involved in cell wall biosynthesis